MLEIGKPIDCPQCRGEGKLATKRRCPICNGEKRVEYQVRDGLMEAPAGSWLPTHRRGRTGYVVVLFGRQLQQQVR